MSTHLPRPDDTGVLAATGELRHQLDALAGGIRDPLAAVSPAGVDPGRMALYRRLFLGNIVRLLAQGFPVLRRTLGEAGWQALVEDFYRDHGCTRPLYTQLPWEFVGYLEHRQQSSDPQWLHALAHYEWAELALQVSTAVDTDDDVDPAGDPMESPPALSALAWPLAYPWPVHRIGPGVRHDAIVPSPTWLLLHRGADAEVRFHALAAPGFRLLQRLDAVRGDSGRAHLQAMATEAGVDCDDQALEDGRALLHRWRALGIVRGTWR